MIDKTFTKDNPDQVSELKISILNWIEKVDLFEETNKVKIFQRNVKDVIYLDWSTSLDIFISGTIALSVLKGKVLLDRRLNVEKSHISKPIKKLHHISAYIGKTEDLALLTVRIEKIGF